MKGKSGRRDFRPKKQLRKRVKDNTLWDDKEGKALFYYLIFATIKAVRGGYFEPVNYLAWLLVAGIWWLAV